jgi:RHS repeat-associated protein
VRCRDREGRWSETSYGALRRVVGTRDAAGRSTSYLWCDCGSLSAIVDPNGNTTSWDRDEQGRVIRERRTDGAFFEYTYEATTSRLKETKDALGQITQYAYNIDDTLSQVSYPNATITTPSVSYLYDAAYNRLDSMTDGTGTTGYTYNAVGTPGAGRLASVDGPLTADTVSYGYDEPGRVVSSGLAAFSTTAAYDALGRVTTIGSSVGNFTYGYDGVTSRPLSFTYPNTQTTSYAYLGGTGDRRLQQIQHKAPGGAVLSQFDYTYDIVGNIGTWQKLYGAGPATLLDLGYDAVDQLTAATKKSTDPTPVTLKRYAYAYDPSGNRTAEQLDDAVVAGSHNSRNQLTSLQPGGTLRFQGSLDEEAKVTVGGQVAEVRTDDTFEGQAEVPSGTSEVDVRAEDYSGNVRTTTYEVSQTGATTTYTYDANGSLTSDGTRTYEWDGANRLVKVKEGMTELASFVYDGQGRRAQKTAGGITRTYIYDGEDILEERLSSGPVYRYVHGPGIDQPFARVSGGAVVAYYLADHLGSIVQETDSAGVVSLTREYDPYGNLIQGTSTGGYAYTAREWDPEVNLYYYRARYYDPKVGRFLSEDPIGLRDGPNKYAYVRSSPTGYVDPGGDVVITAGALVLWGGAILVTAVATAIIIDNPPQLPPLPPLPIPIDPPVPPVPPANPTASEDGPPLVPPVPVPTTPTIEVPSKPFCPPEQSPSDPCVLYALCMSRAQGLAKIRCTPLLIACIGSRFGGS